MNLLDIRTTSSSFIAPDPFLQFQQKFEILENVLLNNYSDLPVKKLDHLFALIKDPDFEIPAEEFAATKSKIEALVALRAYFFFDMVDDTLSTDPHSRLTLHRIYSALVELVSCRKRYKLDMAIPFSKFQRAANQIAKLHSQHNITCPKILTLIATQDLY